MGLSVIVCYRPKAKKERELLAAVRDHLVVLRAEGLVTERTPFVMRAKDGTIVEVFEWKSQAAIDGAHSNPAVLALWERFAEACEYERIANLAEARELFSGFETLEL